MPTLSMPSLIGLNLSDASAKLKEIGLNVIVEGDGGIVIQQLPFADNLLYVGDVVSVDLVSAFIIIKVFLRVANLYI